MKHLSLLILLFAHLCVSAQRQNLIFEQTFDSGPGSWFENSMPTPTSATVSSQIKRTGDKSLRVELKKTDGFRAEFGTDPQASLSKEWVGFSIFIPSGFERDDSPESIVQFQALPDFNLGEQWRSAPLFLGSLKDRFILEIRTDDKPVTTQGNYTFERIDLGAISKDKWTDFVLHIEWAHDQTGKLEVWKNETLVYSRINKPNCYNDKLYPYLKTGIYKWDWAGESNSVTTERLLYIDEIRIGGEKATYQDVHPGSIPQPVPVEKKDQEISFNTIEARYYGDAPFDAEAGASSGLPVSISVVSGPALLQGNKVTVTGTGTITLEASQPGNELYNPAIPVRQSFQVAKKAQTITFPSIEDKVTGDAPFSLVASASSALPVQFKIVSGAASIKDNQLIINSTGTIIVEASQPGNELYNPATPVRQSFQVAKKAQTINFPSIPDRTAGDAPFSLVASASSALPVQFKIVSGAASIKDNHLIINSTGTVIVEASQPGDELYNPATPVRQSFQVAKKAQTINFPSIPDRTAGDAPFSLVASASSALPVQFKIVSGAASIKDNQLIINSTGTIIVEASQPGNELYNPATPVRQSFQVAKKAQTITFANIEDKVTGDAPFSLVASASSALPVQFKIVSGAASIKDNQLIINSTGTIIVEASQPGNELYNPATPVRQSFQVTKKAQTITFPSLEDKVAGGAPFSLVASASSALPVQFKIVSGAASIKDNQLIINSTGTIIVEASQPGNELYNPATPVRQSFQVAKKAQTINFPSIPDRTAGDAPFSLVASASSALPVQFKIVSGAASIKDNQLIINSTGTIIVEASQPGNELYNPATPVRQSFQVAKKAQTITFANIEDKVTGDAPFSLVASASSALPVQFKIVSGAAIIKDNHLIINSTGTVIVEASQPGDELYNPATPVRQSFQVTKKAQTITFPSLEDKVAGDAPFSLVASASSALPVQFKIVSGAAIIKDNHLIINSTGTVIVEASQPGDELYNPATPVKQSFQVTKKAQTIIFSGIEDKVAGEAPFSLVASASSALPVIFKVISGPALITADLISLLGPGQVVIEAAQTGNDLYNPAMSVYQTFKVGSLVPDQVAQLISFPALQSCSFGDTLNLRATASSGLPVDFRVLSGPAVIVGTNLTLTGTGTVMIEAFQNGNYKFLPAPVVCQSFFSKKATGALSINIPSIKTLGTGPFPLEASSTMSTTPICFSSSNPSVLSIWNESGKWMAEALQPGQAVITASQSGDNNHNDLYKTQSILIKESEIQPLLEIFPSPFESHINTRFKLPETTTVEITISNLQGKVVGSLYSGLLTGGEITELRFDTGTLPSGLYIVRLTSAKNILVRKIIKR